MQTRTSPMWTKTSPTIFDNSQAVAPSAATVIDMVAMRPNTLNVSRDKSNNDTKKFIREALHAWRAKVRCNVVPAERLRDLFEELNFSPTERQLNEMLQTAKLFARRGSGLDGRNKHINGLTFGEFCVLAADLKRFRTQQNICKNHDKTSTIIITTTTAAAPQTTDSIATSSLPSSSSSTTNTPNPAAIKSTATLSSTSRFLQNGHGPNNTPTPISTSTVDGDRKPAATFDSNSPEVFLGGSCNPTTWRADVAIPTLNEHGISFYNPQVSDWTPDLIELEHRAKEKARVLFFVMDSETRASAGAIEAAHIAGQNSKHLVLVLHPYKPDQCILNEPISSQEYLDLRRNQQLLEDLLTQRGLPILDSIPSGLQRTRAILAGNVSQSLPRNIASRLISVRRAFDRVISDQALDDKITIAQCQCALTYLGYAQNLLTSENLKEIIDTHRQMETSAVAASSAATTTTTTTTTTPLTILSAKCRKVNSIEDTTMITFDEFCMVASYLTILQQEIYDSGCISPIKGTNLPPPPIFLTNTPEWVHNQNPSNGAIVTTNTTVAASPSSYTKQIYRTSSCKSVPNDRIIPNCCDSYRNRDSGTSSPQPHESKPLSRSTLYKSSKSKSSIDTVTIIEQDHHTDDADRDDDDSDSNDSVFSSECSLESTMGDERHSSGLEICDLYLGGSCMMRTKWRTDIVMPMLNQRGITYHLPTLHESIGPSIDLQYELEKADSGNGSSGSGSGSDGAVPKKRNRKSTQRSSSTLATTESTGTSSSSTLQIQNGIDIAVGANELQRRPKRMFNPALLEASRVLLFVITNETRSLAPMTLAAHYIGLGYNIVLCVQMLPEFCVIGNDRLTPAAIKDYNRGRSYLIDLAKRQGIPVFNEIKLAVECAIEKVKTNNSRKSI